MLNGRIRDPELLELHNRNIKQDHVRTSKADGAASEKQPERRFI
jgi:hypothetical protein